MDDIRNRATKRQPRMRALILSTLLTAVVLPFGAAQALAVTPTTTTVTGPAEPPAVPDLVNVVVHVLPAPQAQDGFTPAVSIYVDGNLSGSEPISPDGSAATNLSLAPGTHSVYAAFGGFGDFGPSQSDPISIDVESATTTSLTSSRNPALNTQSVTYTATVAGLYGYPVPAEPPIGGTLTITDLTTAAVLGTLDVTADARTLAVTTKLATGSHNLKATYSGAGVYRTSSDQLTETIQPDLTVAATGVGSTPATFYPIVDGYRDIVSIRGTRGEAISVAIRIRSVATGALVRSVNLASATGAYAWGWNGRTASGTLQPAGSYRIVQTLTDAAANHRSVTTLVTLSRKRLVERSVTVSKLGDAFSVYGDPGDGYVSRTKSAYSHGVKLASGHAWVAVSYPFTIPSAPVYRTFTFKVLGRSTNGTRATIGIWRPSLGSYTFVYNYVAAKAIGPGYAWYSTSGAGSVLHSGRTARAVVFVEYGPGGKIFDVAKVSLVVRYAVLQ